MTDLRSQLQSTLSGAYTIERELGGGGMSRVFLADETRLGRKVVVKVLSPELAAGISAERFEREIRLAASLQQANIVPVLATGEMDGLPYYTMPFVEGESLRARLGKQPPISLSDTLRILGDVSRALQFAHERGIVHRDIKPDNVLLSGGTAVVTDFGIAKALSASRTDRGAGATLTQLGTSIGTPTYMAPEQAAGDPDADHRADIYALGCMAYELLAGRPPFHGRAPQRVLAAHLSEAPQPIAELRPDVPAALAELVMRCLAKDPAERPQSAAEIILALNGVTSGSGLPALPPVLLHGTSAFRRALLVYFASVIGVAAVAKAATITIGLPAWVLPGALIIMALGLPMILFTGYVQRVTRRALASTPALTPGGSRQPQGTMATLALRASPHVSWRSTTRGGIYALGGFVALIVVFMVMRAFGIGPVGSLFAAGKLKQRDLVLVADFGVSRVDSSVASVVAEGVRAGLAQSSVITLFNPTNVAAALRRMQQPPTTRLDLPVARSLALREGVKAIVTGDVTGLGSGYVIALRLVTPDSGVVLASSQTTVDGPKDLVSGVDELTRKLRGRIGESLKGVQSTPPLEQVTTSSYEALRAYTEGVRLFDRDHDFVKSIPFLRQAVAIDTGFASAWRKLGTALTNAGYPRSASDSAVTRAYRLRGRLSEKERYLTEGYYFFRGSGFDRRRSIAAYEALIRLGDSTAAANNLGAVYSSTFDAVKAESLFRMSIRSSPDNLIPVPNLTDVLLSEGKFAAFDTFAAMGLKRNPNIPQLIEQVHEIHYLRGDYDRFMREIDSVRVATKEPDIRETAEWHTAALLAVRGRLSEAERRMRVRDTLADSLGIGDPPALDSMVLALLDAWFRGAPERAAQRMDAALAANPISSLPERDRPYFELAEAYAQAQRPDRSRALLAQFAQLTDTAYVRAMQRRVHWVLAAIALAEKRPRDAIVEARKATVASDGLRSPNPTPVALQLFLGRAFDEANEPDSAIIAFESYVGSTFADRLVEDVAGLAGAHRRLGELYEARGDYPKAAAHLSAFIDLWKNADPALQPTVAEARKRLARIQAAEKR